MIEALAWTLRARDGFELAWPIALALFACFTLTQLDSIALLARHLFRGVAGEPRSDVRPPTGLVIIPSLLRGPDDFDAITTTVESCATNGYPAELVILASVDGLSEKPRLVRELETWVRSRKYPANVHVHVTGTRTRLGKMMAVEAGLEHMRTLVADGVYAALPEIYFSIDGDGTLGEHALERLAIRLATPHPLTGHLRRVVSGKICIRPDEFWRGFRHFFSMRGQLTIQVAREFLVSNVYRFNWKPTPMIGIPGALYCTWMDVIVEAPRFMGFMQSLRARDALRWWFGGGAPLFSRWSGRSLPEALTGASDDTCIAFIASIAHWRSGRLSFDAPATPLHALGRFLRATFYERSHDYEPEARVYTYTPKTLAGLWKQRVRWNSSRFECGGRFWRAFWFHWEIGFPVVLQLGLILKTVAEMTTYYVLLPYLCFRHADALSTYVLGYLFQTLAYTIYTLLALAIEREHRSFRVTLLALPLASLYCIAINFFGCVVGVVRDLFLFGNVTSFAPEWTLAKSGCQRVALAFRLRRFFALVLRSAIHGDVPLGTFWLGWSETPWTPGGFEGWTTGRAPRAILSRQAKPKLSLVPPSPAPDVDAEEHRPAA